MEAASTRAEYADARFVSTRSERLDTRNGEVDRVESDVSEGIGVRVRVGGAWGFAACHGTERAGAGAALRRARGSPGPRPAAPAPARPREPPAAGTYEVACARDPFEVALEDK